MKKLIFMFALLLSAPAYAAMPLNIVGTCVISNANPTMAYITYTLDGVQPFGIFTPGNQDITLDQSPNPSAGIFQNCEDGVNYYAQSYMDLYVSDAEIAFPGVFEEGSLFLINPMIGTSLSNLAAELAGKQNVIIAGPHINDSATNANTNLESYSVGVSGVNVPTHASYSALVIAHNDLAVKYNDLATKFNALVDSLEAQGIQSP